MKKGFTLARGPNVKCQIDHQHCGNHSEGKEIFVDSFFEDSVIDVTYNKGEQQRQHNPRVGQETV